MNNILNPSSFSFSEIKTQLLKIVPAVGLSIFIALAGAGITVLAANATGNPIWKLAKDPAEILDFPPYIGLLSNWGALLWMATATICLFSALVIKQQRAGTPTIRFIGASGVLSLILAIDDLFLLHDRLLPELLHTPEITFYILYLIGILGYLLYFMPQILKHEYLLLGVAVLCFGLSRRYFVTLPFFDQFLTTGDMLKYFGIVFWLAFFSRTAFQEVGNALKASQP